MNFEDSVRATFGASNDLQVYHDGSNSYIQNETGILYIWQGLTDGDISFVCDDGSGGETSYLTLDGGLGYTTVQKRVRFNDDISLALGSDNDLQLSHDATNSYISNSTGNLEIINNTDDKDIIFKCDDGSGGVTPYFFLDGSAGYTMVKKRFNFSDNVEATFGTSEDLKIYHDASNSYIEHNGTGDLKIYNGTNDGDVLLRCDDGSGGVATYLALDGGISSLIAYRDILLATDGTNGNLKLGASQDLILNHDGTDSKITNSTGDLKIVNLADDKDIIFQSDNGSGGDATYFRLDGSEVETRFHKSTLHYDSIQAKYGDSGDLQIQHNGTDSQITNSTGHLQFTNTANNSDISFASDNGAGSDAIYFFLDGSAAEHDGSATTALYTNWPDNSRVAVGTGRDLQLDHNGTDSVIRNETGDLYIMNKADDKDIILQTDDGSGGTTAYITLDGSATEILLAQTTKAQGTNLTVEPSSGGNGQLNVTRTSGATTFIQSQSATGIVGTSSNHKLDIKTNSSTRLSIATSGDATFNHNVIVTGNITANGNIIGDDSTSITNISSIGADSYGADADSTTRFTMGATQIDCLVADTDVFQVTDSSFTFDGAIQTIIKKRKFTKTTNTDGNADGDIVYFGGTTSMTTGAIYHYKSDGTWELADADSAATCDGLLGVALGAASNTNGVLLRGMVTLDHDPGAVGDVLFVSTTAGDATATAPSGSGDIVRVIGYCIDASNGQIWFNPDGTFVEVA